MDTTFFTRRTLYNYNLLDTGRKSLQVRLRVTENLLPIFLIPVTVRTEEFANLFVSPKISRTLGRRENQSLVDLLEVTDKNLGRFNELSNIKIMHALVDLYDIWTYYRVPLAAPSYE